MSEAGSRRFVVSDYEGAFRLGVEMPGATIRLTVRKIGFRPIDTTITVSPGNTERLRLFTEALPVSLATVHVAGAAGYDACLDQRGYYRRWAAIGGLGFIGPDAIDRRNPTEATQMLRDVPGVRVESLGGNKGVKKNFVRPGWAVCFGCCARRSESGDTISTSRGVSTTHSG